MTDARTFGLTAKARDCLDYLASYAEATGVMPSHVELMRMLDLRSKSGVNRILRQLEARGHIERLARKPRAIRIRSLSTMTIDVPPELQGRLVQAAHEAGRKPDAHVAALINAFCPAVRPF